MKQSNKNRQNGRHSNNRFGNNRYQGSNAITRNTAFDSSSVAGRVRGTAQQLIDKYLSLAKDAKAQDDRVLYETYLQYADHYTRMLELAIQNEQLRQAAIAQQQAQRVANVPETEQTSESSNETVESATEEVVPETKAVEEVKKIKQGRGKVKKMHIDGVSEKEASADPFSLPVADSVPLSSDDSEVTEKDTVPQPVVIEIPE